MKPYYCPLSSSASLLSSESRISHVNSPAAEIVNQNVAVDESVLHSKFKDQDYEYQIGVDEAGRGPLFGRVYTAAVILPKPQDAAEYPFDYTMVKDSKRFHSEKKIQEAAEYIKKHAIAWHVSFEENDVIDRINIRQATLGCMRNSIKGVMNSIKTQHSLEIDHRNTLLMIDGNDFMRMTTFDKTTETMTHIPHVCIEGGDNTYAVIAAASILAKVSRDSYIDDLCSKYPVLDELYGIKSNKGYGAKKHMDGIKEHGITQWHRRSYGICKDFVI